MQNLILFLSSILFLSLTTFAANDASIIGNWKAPDLENSTIQVYKSNDGYFYGKIIESDKPEWVDEVILKKVKYFPEDEVWKGKIYSLKRKMSIDVTINLETENKLKLVGKKLFMTKTFYWTR